MEIDLDCTAGVPTFDVLEGVGMCETGGGAAGTSAAGFWSSSAMLLDAISK